MDPVRLQKALALAGVSSRRAAESLIREGAVAVNGVVIREMGIRVVPGQDAITVKGVPAVFEAPLLTLMFNKPRGIICSADSSQGETVFDLLGEIPHRLFTIGRLDKMSEGLLLLTNDGDLALRLTHPRYEHRKIYEVRVAGNVSLAVLKTLNGPLVIDGHSIGPSDVSVLSEDIKNHQTLLSFTLLEGRNRQIRKMCDLAGLRILQLCRVQVGNLKLGRLPTGKYRVLTEREMSALVAPPA